MALQSSQRLPELHSTRRNPAGFFSSNSTWVPTYVYINPENSPYVQSNSTCRRQRALRVLHTEGKETFSPERNSTHRGQGDLLEIHPCVLQDLPKIFQAFQPQDLPKAFQTFQPIQAILQVPVSPGNPPHFSILQLECIFYKQFQFDWFPQKTPPSTSWTIQDTNYKLSFFKEREML